MAGGGCCVSGEYGVNTKGHKVVRMSTRETRAERFKRNVLTARGLKAFLFDQLVGCVEVFSKGVDGGIMSSVNMFVRLTSLPAFYYFLRTVSHPCMIDDVGVLAICGCTIPFGCSRCQMSLV